AAAVLAARLLTAQHFRHARLGDGVAVLRRIAQLAAGAAAFAHAVETVAAGARLLAAVDVVAPSRLAGVGGRVAHEHVGTPHAAVAAALADAVVWVAGQRRFAANIARNALVFRAARQRERQEH